MSLRSDSPVLSSDALAAQLTQSLPVHISSEAVQELPKLAILLEDLSHHLCSSAVLSSTQQALSCSSTILRHSRRVYLEHEALLHYALSAAKSPTAPTSLRQLEDAVSLSQLACSLQLVPTEPVPRDVSNVSRQCIESDKLIASVAARNISSSGNGSVSVISDSSSCSNSWHSANGSSKSFNNDKRNSNDKQSSTSSLQVALKNKPNNMRDPLVPQLSSSRALRARASRLAGGGGRLLHQHTSDRLTEAWRNILPGLTPLLPDDTKAVVAPSGASVSSHLATLRRAVANSNKTLTAHAALVHALLLQVDGQLVEYGTSLVGLVQQRRLSHHPLHHLQYLATTLHAQHHKLRCVELQIKCSTYSTEAVASLKALSRRLASLTEETTRQLASLQYRLEPYSRLDPSYLSLLDEYSKLRSDIEFCQADHS